MNGVTEGTGYETEYADREAEPDLMCLVFGKSLGEGGGEGGAEVTETLGDGSDEGDLGFGGGKLGEREVVVLEDSEGDGETLSDGCWLSLACDLIKA